MVCIMCVLYSHHQHDTYQPENIQGVDIMRIVWKDSVRSKTYHYRDYTISRYEDGWITDLPGDDNIYYSAEMAHNAVDQILGGKTRKANPRRHGLGIKVIGKKPGRGNDSCA